MTDQRVNGHTVSSLTVHIVWRTKYRYPALTDDIQKQCRAFLIEVFDAEGVESEDRVHMHIESQNLGGYQSEHSLTRIMSN